MPLETGSFSPILKVNGPQLNGRTSAKGGGVDAANPTEFIGEFGEFKSSALDSQQFSDGKATYPTKFNSNGFYQGKTTQVFGAIQYDIYIYIDTMIQVFGAKLFEELIAFFGHSFAI